jgi:signal transduction histidine kinase
MPGLLRGRRLVRRPRSIRNRLVATYTVIAVLLAAIALSLFVVLVHRSLSGSLDASLATRATPVVAALGENPLPDLQALTGTGAKIPGKPDPTLQPELDAIAFVLRPDGTMAAANPNRLPEALFAEAERARADTTATGRTVRIGDDHIRMLFIPVTRHGATWVVGVGADQAVVESTAREAIHQLYVAVPVFILLAAIGAWLLSGAALEPVERMRTDVETIGERDLDTRISVPDTADELARLAQTFNALLDRLRGSVDRQRNLVADAGHELRTPLAVLSTELELADRPERSREELLDAIRHARAEVGRLNGLAEGLLFLARADGSAAIIEPREADVISVIGDAVRATRARAEAEGILIAVEAPGELWAWIDPDALRRAVDNLIANAVSAMARSPHPSPGTHERRVVISAGATSEASEAATPPVVTVAVSDTGPGFPPEFIGHAFSRFRRADTSRTSSSGGYGLGLAIVAEIAAAHGGTATAANNAGPGATVTIRIPRWGDQAARGRRGQAGPAASAVAAGRSAAERPPSGRRPVPAGGSGGGR